MMLVVCSERYDRPTEKVSKRAVRMEFSHLLKGFEHCASSNNIPQNLPTIVRRDWTAKRIVEVPSLTLLTALSVIPFVSDR